jgi:polyphosphate kinase 2 (PPK2 family)
LKWCQSVAANAVRPNFKIASSIADRSLTCPNITLGPNLFQSCRDKQGTRFQKEDLVLRGIKNESHTTPEKAKLTRKEYEGELRKLQVELCKLQDWVKREGLRIIVVFEGRDAAGKGGTIKAITERVSPRVFRIVALPAPSDREKTQIYICNATCSTSRQRGRS